MRHLLAFFPASYISSNMKQAIFTFILLASLKAVSYTPSNELLTYSVTNLQSRNEANEIFNNLYRNRKDWSQCYDRAHYWSYQLFRNHGIYTSKVFIFFTKKYTREINNRWWFHVAPSFDVQGRQHVLDPEFLSKPVPYEVWKNGAIDHAHYKLVPLKKKLDRQLHQVQSRLSQHQAGSQAYRNLQKQRSAIIQKLKDKLILNSKLIPVTNENFPYRNMRQILDLKCKHITKYSEFEQNQESQYCYIMTTDMFFWAPLNIENLEEGALFPNQFNSNDVFTAFKRAFWGRYPY